MENPSSARTIREWKRFGALPYLCLRLGSQIFMSIMTILLILRFAMGETGSGTKHQTLSATPQIGVIVMMTVFITFSNLLGQLRILALHADPDVGSHEPFSFSGRSVSR